MSKVVRKNAKRMFAMVIALAMVLTLLPVTALAGAEDTATAGAATDGQDIFDLGADTTTEPVGDDPASVDGGDATTEPAPTPDTTAPAPDTDASLMGAFADAAADDGFEALAAPTVSEETGKAGTAVDLDKASIISPANNYVKMIYDIKAGKVTYDFYAVGLPAEGGNINVFFSGIPAYYAVMKKDATEYGAQQTAGSNPTTVSGVQSEDSIIFYNTDGTAYVTVKVYAVAQIAITTSTNDATKADELTVKGDFKKYPDDVWADKNTVMTLLPEPTPVPNQTTYNIATLNKMVYDVDDTLTFTVNPLAGRKATVTSISDDETEATVKEYAYKDGGTEVPIDLTQSKLYTIDIKYDVNSLTLNSAFPAGSTAPYNGTTGYSKHVVAAQDADYDYEVYYVTGTPIDLKFVSNTTGKIDVTSDKASHTISDTGNTDDTVALTPAETNNAALDTAVLTFTRGVATTKVKFIQTALVNLTVGGPTGSGLVKPELIATMNTAEYHELFHNKPQYPGNPTLGEIFDIKGRTAISGNHGSYDSTKGDQFKFTISPNTTTGHYLSEVSVNGVKQFDFANGGFTNPSTGKVDGLAEDPSKAGQYVYTLNTATSQVLNIVVTLAKAVTVTSVAVDDDTPVIGETLTAVTDPTALSNVTYQWYSNSDPDAQTGDPVSGGQGAPANYGKEKTFKPTTAEDGQYIYVVVTDQAGKQVPSNVTAAKVRYPSIQLTGFLPTNSLNVSHVEYTTPEEITAATGVHTDIYYVDGTPIKLTFGGEAKGPITVDSQHSANVDATGSEYSNAVTVKTYSDNDTITFTRQSAQYKVRFNKVAKVNLKLDEATKAQGNVAYEVTRTDPDESVIGELNETAASSVELLENNETVKLTATPKAGMTVKSFTKTVTTNGTPVTTVDNGTAGTGATAGTWTYSATVTAGTVTDIVVTFAAAPPATKPNATNEPKSPTGALAATLSTGMNTTGTAQIDAATTGPVAFNMYTTTDMLGNLVFPGLATDKTVFYMQAGAGAADWVGGEKIYEGKVDATAGSRILFYTGYGDWFKVDVTAKALVKGSIVGGDTTDKTVTVEYVENNAAAKPAIWGAAQVNAWLLYGIVSENYVKLTVKSQDQATVTLNGGVIPATSTDTTKQEAVYQIGLSAANLYGIVVTYANQVITAESDKTADLAEVVSVKVAAGQEVTLTGNVTGDVSFMVPDNVTVVIEKEIAHAVKVSGGGTVEAGNVTVTAAGQEVKVEGGMLDVKQLTVSDGASMTLDGGNSKMVVAEDITLGAADGSGAAVAVNVANGSTLEIAKDAALAVTNANVTVGAGSTLDIKSANAAIETGSRLDVSDTGKVTVEADAKLDIRGDMAFNSTGAFTVNTGAAINVSGNGTLNVGGGASFTVSGGSVINVTEGAMTIGAVSGNKLTASGAASIVIGGAAANLSGGADGMEAMADAAATLTVTEELEIPVSVPVTVNATGELIVDNEAALTIVGRLTNLGKITVKQGARFRIVDDQSVKGVIVDENGIALTPNSDGWYVARGEITIIPGVPPATPSAALYKRTLSFTGMAKGDYIAYQVVTTLADGTVDRDFQMIQAYQDDEVEFNIYYRGDSKILIMIFDGKGEEPKFTDAEDVPIIELYEDQ